MSGPEFLNSDTLGELDNAARESSSETSSFQSVPRLRAECQRSFSGCLAPADGHDKKDFGFRSDSGEKSDHFLWSALRNDFEGEEDTDIAPGKLSKNRDDWFQKFTNQYGADFSMLTSKVVSVKTPVDTAANFGYEDYVKTLIPRAEVDVEELQETFPEARVRGRGPSVEYHSEWRRSADGGVWELLFGPEFVHRWGTHHVQAHICAALNSRKLLRLVIGVDPHSLCEGVQLTREELDCIRRTYDMALDCEFVPPLDPRAVSLNFVRVVGAPQGDRRFIIEVATKATSEQMYQLSSGRVFFVSEDGMLRLHHRLDEARLQQKRRCARASAARFNAFACALFCGAMLYATAGAVGARLSKP